MNSCLQIPKSILKPYVYSGSSIFISTITLKKKKKEQKLLTISQVSTMGTEHEGVFLSYKSEVEVDGKCMPHTKTL